MSQLPAYRASVQPAGSWPIWLQTFVLVTAAMACSRSSSTPTERATPAPSATADEVTSTIKPRVSAGNGVAAACNVPKRHACVAYTSDGSVWTAQGESKLRADCVSNAGSFTIGEACPKPGSMGTCLSLPQGMISTEYAGSVESHAQSPKAYARWCRDIQGGTYAAP